MCLCVYVRIHEYLFIYLEHVLNGVTQQPISLLDFRYYLLKKEHSAENLEFHYWLQSYKTRFNDLPEARKSLAPPPTETLDPDFCKVPNEKNYANLNQPFRDEIEATVKTYFNSESLKALNLPSNIINYTAYCSNGTTHPDVFEEAYAYIYKFMEEKSLKQFIHLAVQNIQYSFIVYQYTIAAVSLLVTAMFLFNSITLNMSRWSRLALFFLIFFLVSGFLAGRSGFCMMRSCSNLRQVPIYMSHLADPAQQAGGKPSRANRVQTQDLECNTKPCRDLSKVMDKEVIKYNKVSVLILFLFSR